MKYLINNDILFKTDDFTLTHIPTSEVVKLSISTGRLLEKIIDSKGNVLSRDSILADVWDKYGLRGSNNNLSQYMSFLRRTLGALGCDNFIVTIPRIGFMLNKDLSIKSVNSEMESFEKKINEKTKIKKSEKKLYILTFILLISYNIYNFALVSKENEIDLTHVISNKKCNIMYTKDYGKNEIESLNFNIYNILKENDLECNPETVIYFDEFISNSINNLGRTLVSYCKFGEKKEIASCINIYYFDRGKNE